MVERVEPPNWWLGLTPDVMLLVYGRNLQTTQVSCNLPEVTVSRTNSTADGKYLFVWLKFSPQLHSGTLVCRILTSHGRVSFELPVAARTQILGRNQGISQDDVLYQIVPDRFANGDPRNDEPPEFPGSLNRNNPRAYHGGDLQGVEQHLDYLKDLGITTVSLTSILKNRAAQDPQAYGVLDFYSVDPHFGTLQNYQQLVRSAHEKRLKILFNVVNRVASTHPWVAHPPMPDWFYPAGTPAPGSVVKSSFYGQGDYNPTSNDLLEALSDPHTAPPWRRHLLEGGSGEIRPNLNTGNSVVVQYLEENSIWWAERSGLDGYSIDGFPYVSRAFWEQWHATVRNIYPRLSTIGEVPHPAPTVTSFYQGGRKGWDGLDTQLTTLFDYPLQFALRDVLLQAAPIGELANVLRKDALYPHPDFLIPFLDNRETPRFQAVPLGSAVPLELALGLLCTMRGIPQLYYGDEIGLAGGLVPDNQRDFPGGWTEDGQSAFHKDTQTREQQMAFAYVHHLLQLRSEHEALRNGKMWNLYSDDSTYIFLRESDDEALLVAFHPRNPSQDISLPFENALSLRITDVTSLLGPGSASINFGKIDLKLPAQSFTIFALH